MEYVSVTYSRLIRTLGRPWVGATLSDLLVYKVIAAGISQRDRYKYWPLTFHSGVNIVMERSNIDPAANQVQNSTVRDLIFWNSYNSHGDFGAKREGDKKPTEDR